MHPAGKFILGLILVFGSIWWIVQGSQQYIQRSGYQDLITVINGAVPVLILILGIFIIWLELDELKIERELKRKK